MVIGGGVEWNELEGLAARVARKEREGETEGQSEREQNKLINRVVFVVYRTDFFHTRVNH